jgi:hypothetical protein
MGLKIKPIIAGTREENSIKIQFHEQSSVTELLKAADANLLANTILLVFVFLCFLFISTLELCNLAKALSHLTLGPHVIHFASMVDLGHHYIDQPTTLRHI